MKTKEILSDSLRSEIAIAINMAPSQALAMQLSSLELDFNLKEAKWRSFRKQTAGAFLRTVAAMNGLIAYPIMKLAKAVMESLKPIAKKMRKQEVLTKETVITLVEREYDHVYKEIQQGSLTCIPTRTGTKLTFVGANDWGLWTGRERKNGTCGDLVYRVNIRKFIEKGILSQEDLDQFKADGHSEREICGGNTTDMSNAVFYLIDRLSIKRHKSANGYMLQKSA